MSKRCYESIRPGELVRRAALAAIASLIGLAACGSSPAQPPDVDAPPIGDDASPPGKRIAILVIGDGMGRAQLDAASHVAHGAAGRLFLEGLPVRGQVITSGPSGTTDSAASATTMATGARAFNGAIGLDRDGAPRETLVELAHRLGMPAGVVSTSALPHATPGAFTAHRDSRHALAQIADDQVRVVRPDVMLGGGSQYFLPAGPGSVRGDDGLLDELASAGYVVVRTADELAAARAELPIAGLFASEHLAYSTERTPATTEPTLTEMAMAAIERLDAAAPEGFFLMIEGSRIDMASHGNLLPEMVGDMLELDRTVETVAAWAAGRDDVTLLVTADHECGGLEIVRGNGAGNLPDVTWRWGQHTNAAVDLFARGPGTEVLDGKTIDHRDVHALLAARLAGTAFEPPALELLPDGRLGDLPHVAVTQAVTESGFGPGRNQLDALHLAADPRGLALGIAGVFEQRKNAVVVLIDVDFGAATGFARLAGALSDRDGRADAILASLSLDAPLASGFGADLALVAWGAEDPAIEHVIAEAGLRGLRPPYGQPNDLGWYGVATNFGDGTRALGHPAPPATPSPDRGWEVHIPWDRLYPSGAPGSATIALAAVLVNDDGGFTSNQALPPFPAGTANPGRTITRLPGIVVVTVEGNAITSSTVMP
jgi:alkaline phosphatase